MSHVYTNLSSLSLLLSGEVFLERALWEGSYDHAFRLKVQAFNHFEDAIAINPLLSLFRCGNICYERGVYDGGPRVQYQDQKIDELKGKASLTMFLMEQAKKEKRKERKGKKEKAARLPTIIRR